MEACFFYLLKMLCCSAILYGYYRVALYNERFHHWNRFYLLASMMLSAIIPVIDIPLVKYNEASDITTAIALLPWNVVSRVEQPVINWQQFALYASLIVSVFLLSRLVYGILKITRLLKGNKIIGLQNNVSLILTSVKDAPFSFLNWLFWRQDIDPESDNGKRILNHELTHIREGHTVDKLLASVLVCVFWMNPFFWLIRKELGTVHEFLADRKAIGTKDGAAFANMILQSIILKPGINPNLVNPFFSSTIKRRLFMITTSTIPKYSYLRRISGLAIMICSFFALAISIQHVQAQNNTLKKPAKHSLTKTTDTTKSATTKTIVLNQTVNKKVADKKSEEISITADTLHFNSNGSVSINGHGTVVTTQKGENGKLKGSVSQVIVSANNLTLTDGKNSPLYIVDGKEVTAATANALDPDKIMSVNVIKGEPSIAKYGAGATNGVVEINLKNNVEPSAKVVVVGKKGDQSIEKVVVVGYGTKKVSANPLIIVDGNEVSNDELKKIDPKTIESMNVLKDEKAKEKYGDKGMDGVIEITTKKAV